MPSEAATSYFHQGSTITYSNLVIIDLWIPCKGNTKERVLVFLLVEHIVGIKFICNTKFGPKI